ncbi:MAG: hypothetical protein F4087_13550 [Gemmatimonadetes bacterium]|nr:hypothetical protein [Gemmatimonadota bacterium]MYJ69514.1 hypothetical protein [Gemmatimonadota bacterium]
MFSIHSAVQGLPSAVRAGRSALGRVCRAAIVLLCAGCGVSDRSDVAGPSRTDSAGVEIVRNADEPLRRGELVQPARRVFGSEEEGPELFGRVGTTRLHANGSLWITDAQAQEIRVFDPGSGAHLFTIGGRGDGPGEFRRSDFLGFDGEGSAYVYDHEHRRLSVYASSGEFLRSHLLPSTLGISPLPQHVTRAGTLFGQISRGPMERMPARGSTVRDTVRTWTMPLDGTAPALVSKTLGALFYFHDGESVAVPFSGGSPRGFRDDRVYAIDGVGEASYSVYGPAGLERRVEIDRPPRRIDDRAVAMFREGMRRSPVPESQRRIYEEHLSDMPIPDARRHWDGMLFTDQGEVWLRRTGDAVEATAGDPADAHVWDVFDAGGIFIGHMRLPANVWLEQVIGQTALTTARDDLDRETVAIHDIRWIG